MGRLFTTFSRASKGGVDPLFSSNMLSLFKNPSMMQSSGVKVECIHLFRIAHDCCLEDYRIKNPSTKETIQCVVNIHTSRGPHGRCREKYSAVANVVTMGKNRAVLETVFLTNRDYRQSINKKSACVDCEGYDNAEIPTDALLYTNKKAAKNDLLWFLATRNGNASRWIHKKFHKQKWTVMSRNGSESTVIDNTLGNKENEGLNAFLLLSLENRPSSRTDGSIFCSLMYGEKTTLPSGCVKKGYVLASFFDKTKDHCVFPLVQGDLVLQDVTVTTSDGLSIGTHVTVKPSHDPSPDVRDQTRHPNIPISVALKEVPAHKSQVVASHATLKPLPCKRQPKEGEPRRPLPVDVFLSMTNRRSLYKDIPTIEYPMLMEKWRPYWLDSLAEWKSIFVPRGGPFTHR